MTYPGGKGASGAVQAIINQQPPHSMYVEPFAGGAAVLLAKRPATFNRAMDLDPGAIAALSDLPGCKLTCEDGISWLEKVAPHFPGNVLIYCDPPYLPSARARANRRLYRYEMSEIRHRQFLRAVRSLKCMVQISGYWSSLYAQMLEGWRLVTFKLATRGTARTGKMATECLWMNYPSPTVLHDYRFLGSDYRERERIRRKTARWIDRINSLPVLERAAIFSAMKPGGRAENDDSGRLSSRLAARGPAPETEVLQ